VNSPGTHGGQIRDGHGFLLGSGNSKWDSAKYASLSSENAKPRTAQLANGISKVSPCSIRQKRSQIRGLSLLCLMKQVRRATTRSSFTFVYEGSSVTD